MKRQFLREQQKILDDKGLSFISDSLPHQFSPVSKGRAKTAATGKRRTLSEVGASRGGVRTADAQRKRSTIQSGAGMSRHMKEVVAQANKEDEDRDKAAFLKEVTLPENYIQEKRQFV